MSDANRVARRATPAQRGSAGLRCAVWLGMAAGVAGLGGRAGAQITVSTSHPGSLPGQPTTSMLLGGNLTQVRGWWSSPAHAVQTTWKSSITSRAGGSLALSQPTDFTTSAAQSQIAQARAFRWLMNPQAATAADDLASVVDVLSNYARATGGTTITRPEVVQNYYQAFDFINAGLTAEQRTAITSRLSGSNVKGSLTAPFQINNQQLKHASTRAFGALLFNDKTDLDAQLVRINQSLGANSTDDGGYTDGLRYLNYGIAQFAPFAVAYAHHTGVSLAPQAEPFVRMGLGMRLPNGTTPSAHNNDNAPVAISHFTRLIADANLKAAALWNTTALAGHDWTTWTNVVNNDWTYTDFFALTDFSVAPAAPTWSPTFFSGGQAQAATLRNGWHATSHMLNLSAGIDGASGAGFVHHDTGGLTVAANGTQVLVEPGYDRTGLSTTPSGFDSSVATAHNVFLARDTGNATWGIGNGSAQTNAGTSVTTTNRLDAAERGDSKGVADFVTLRATYGGSSAGNDVQARRSVAMLNESESDGGYFVVADAARRTDSTNKDFAVNLIGKSAAADTAVVFSSGTLVQLRWAVDAYAGDGFNGGQTMTGVPYTQPQSGQVVAHIVASQGATLAVTQDTTWMMENYNVYLQTQRMRVAATNLADVAFLTILEPGAFGDAIRLGVTPLSGPGFAAARVTNEDEGWTDWMISQTSAADVHATAAGVAVSIDDGALVSDAHYAYLRRRGAILDSALISRGTSLAAGGATLLQWSHPVTVSLLVGTAADPVLRGTLSADDLVSDTVLTLSMDSLLAGHRIGSASLGGQPLPFTNGSGTSTVTLAGATGGQFVIAFEPVPEPAAAVLTGAAALGLLARRAMRRRRQRLGTLRHPARGEERHARPPTIAMHTPLFRSLVVACCLAAATGARGGETRAAAAGVDGLRAGWATGDITPERPVTLRGQMYRRISEGVRDPLTCTALALESVHGDAGDQAVLVSCDLISIGPELVDAVAAEIESRRERAPGLDPAKVVLNATHTHTGPHVEGTVDDLPPGVMTPGEYRAFAVSRIAEAAITAWNARRPTEVSWALGHASVARNRRVVSLDSGTGLPLAGGTQMYGKTSRDTFDSIEGGADTGLGLVCFWNPGGGLAGLIVNVPCPSQESENERRISADFWHETRADLRRRLGDEVVVFAQCGAGGDCTGRNVWRNAAEEEMLRRRGLTSRAEIGRRIGNAVSDLMPIARQGAQAAPEFAHAIRTVDLPQRLVTPAERDRCLADAGAAKTAERKGWQMQVVRRFEKQQAKLESGGRPTVPIRVHAIRLGDVAIVTNPFELFLDYGVRIQARSPATLTCVVQLAGRGTHGTYLPTFRAVEGGGYSAVIESNVVGPEGGRVLVDESVKMLQELWKPRPARPTQAPPVAGASTSLRMESGSGLPPGVPRLAPGASISGNPPRP